MPSGSGRERCERFEQRAERQPEWLGEMERLHLHIQQLQLELADVREKSGSNLDGSHTSQTHLKDASELGQSNASQVDANGNVSPGENHGSVQNGNSENASGGNTSTQADNVHVVAFAPSSLLGMPTYVPSGQVTAMHPFVMHQQGVPHPSHVLQSHFHSVSAMPSSIQNWQQAQPDSQHAHNQFAQETEHNLMRTDSQHHDFEASGNGQIHHASDVNTNISRALAVDICKWRGPVSTELAEYLFPLSRSA